MIKRLQKELPKQASTVKSDWSHIALLQTEFTALSNTLTLH